MKAMDDARTENCGNRTVLGLVNQRLEILVQIIFLINFLLVDNITLAGTPEKILVFWSGNFFHSRFKDRLGGAFAVAHAKIVKDGKVFLLRYDIRDPLVFFRQFFLGVLDLIGLCLDTEAP